MSSSSGGGLNERAYEEQPLSSFFGSQLPQRKVFLNPFPNQGKRNLCWLDFNVSSYTGASLPSQANSTSGLVPFALISVIFFVRRPSTVSLFQRNYGILWLIPEHIILYEHLTWSDLDWNEADFFVPSRFWLRKLSRTNLGEHNRNKTIFL